MSEDSFSEVTHTSWGGRIKTSFKGILFGLVLFVGAFPLLFWNEGRAVKRYRTLKEGQGQVVSIADDRVDPENQGRLVHVSGIADTRQTITDTTFAVSRQVIHLKRAVEMYQWREDRETRTDKKVGGGERKVTTYSYTKVWSTTPIRSSGFKRRSGHENPGSMPFTSETFSAARVTLGAFVLPAFLVREIDDWEPLAMDGTAPLPSALGAQGQVFDGGYYRGRDPGDPAVGDLRISFKVVEPGPVSLIAAQSGETFAAYTTATGGTISLLQTGTAGAAEMFATAHFHNRLLTWGIRAGGLLIMFIGLAMLLKPLSVFADVIPILGNIVQTGTGIFAFMLALVFSLAVMGVAWLFYRPLLGIALMAGAASLVALLLMKRKGRAKVPPAVVDRAPVGTAPLAPPSPPAVPPPSANPPPPPPPPVAAADEPDAPPAAQWIGIGKQAYADNRLDQAVDAFEKAVALEPTNASILFNLGVVRKKAGDAAGATAAFRRAADLGHARARAMLSSGGVDP